MKSPNHRGGCRHHSGGLAATGSTSLTQHRRVRRSKPRIKRRPHRASIGVLVAVKETLIRVGILSVLRPSKDIEILGEATNAPDALEKAVSLQPDVVLVDMNGNSAGATRAIKERCPEARILVLTDAPDLDFVGEVTNAGAVGCVPKDIAPLQLVDAVRAMRNGNTTLSPHITSHDAASRQQRPDASGGRPPGLTPRTVDVLKGVAAGLSDKEIAEQLLVSEWTVKAHLRAMYRRFNIRNRAHAAVFAIEKGL